MRHRRFRPILERLESRYLLTGGLELLADLHPGPESSFTDLGLPHFSAVSGGDFTFFVARSDDEAYSQRSALWAVPTAGGTPQKLLDHPIVEPRTGVFRTADGTVYHYRGSTLYRINADPPSLIPIPVQWSSSFAVVGDTIYGQGPSNLRHPVTGELVGSELARLNVVNGQWEMVADIRAGSNGSVSQFVGGGENYVYFYADDGIRGRELWASDGTEAGTRILGDLNAVDEFNYPTEFRVAGDNLYFLKRFFNPTYVELWYSRAGAPAERIETYPQLLYGTMTSLGGDLLFASYDNQSGQRHEVWRASGETGAVELLLSRINSLTNDGGEPHRGWGVLNDEAYFFLETASNQPELWKTDGTAVGTDLVADLEGVAQTNVAAQDFLAVGDYLYFSYDHYERFGPNSINYGRELWRTDGTFAGTELVADLRAGSQDSNPRFLSEVDGNLVFIADDGVHGVEPWILRPVPDIVAKVITRQANAGEDVRFAFEWEIRATDLTEETTIDLVWSSDATFDPDDTLAFRRSLSGAELAVGTYSDAVLVAGLSPAPQGSRYLLLVADPIDTIYEANESNNAVSHAFCDVGAVIADVVLPAQQFDVVRVKTLDLEWQFHEIALDLTVESPTEAAGLCRATTETGRLPLSLVNKSTGSSWIDGESVGVAHLELIDGPTQKIRWNNGAGFQVWLSGSRLWDWVTEALFQWSEEIELSEINPALRFPETSFEQIVREAEAYLHAFLSERNLSWLSKWGVIEDPGATDLLVTDSDGNRTGTTDDGQVVLEIPGSFYDPAVPVVGLIHPAAGLYETQVRGQSVGDYEVVMALIEDGKQITGRQEFGGPIQPGISVFYESTITAGDLTTQITSVEIASGGGPIAFLEPQLRTLVVAGTEENDILRVQRDALDRYEVTLNGNVLPVFGAIPFVDNVLNVRIETRSGSDRIDLSSLLPAAMTLRVLSDEEDTIQFGVGWTLHQPELIDGQFLHLLKQGEARIEVVGTLPFRNPLNALDSNRDGVIAPLDALTVINRLNTSGAGPLPLPEVANDLVGFSYVDTNGDSTLSPNDVLLIVNFLNSLAGNSEGEWSAPPTYSQMATVSVNVLSAEKPLGTIIGVARGWFDEAYVTSSQRNALEPKRVAALANLLGDDLPREVNQLQSLVKQVGDVIQSRRVRGAEANVLMASVEALSGAIETDAKEAIDAVFKDIEDGLLFGLFG